MFGDDKYIGESEKIDYIYKKLKSQSRYALISLAIKFLILLFIVYTGYFFYSGKNSELTDKLTLKFRESIVSIINPILNEVLGSLTLKQINPSNNSVSTSDSNINISKEDIQKALNMINKK